MIGNKAIVELINDNYTMNVKEEHVWNDEIERERAAWCDVWDEERQQIIWCRRGQEGEWEISNNPPAIDIQRVILAREKLKEKICSVGYTPGL